MKTLAKAVMVMSSAIGLVGVYTEIVEPLLRPWRKGGSPVKREMTTSSGAVATPERVRRGSGPCSHTSSVVPASTARS